MVTDRDLVAGDGELPMPESVQGIVAARLDALPENEKTLLQDASVLGKVFWLGAAAEIGSVDRFAAEDALHRLERKEFVRRERRPSVAGRTSTRSVTCSSETSRTTRSRAPVGRRSTGSPATGSSASAAPKTTPRCSPTTTPTLSSSRVPRARTRIRTSGRRGEP